MTLNGVIAIILRYFTEFDRLAGHYVAVVKYRFSIQNILFQLYFGQNCLTQQSHGLFATAQLLVLYMSVAYTLFIIFLVVLASEALAVHTSAEVGSIVSKSTPPI